MGAASSPTSSSDAGAARGFLSKSECARFPNIHEFLSGNGAPCDGKSKARGVKFCEGQEAEYYDLDVTSLEPANALPDHGDTDARTAELVIVEKADAALMQLILKKRVSDEDRLSFLKCLDDYLEDQPSFNFSNVQRQLSPMPSVLSKQRHVAFKFVTAREFDRPFRLGYREVQAAGKAAGAWRIGRTWGPMNPVQRKETEGFDSQFCPIAVTRTQAAVWFNGGSGEPWSFGVVLLDEPPLMAGLPGRLRPSYHLVGGELHLDYRSSSELLLQCMLHNGNLQGNGIPPPLVAAQDLYRVVGFEWSLLLSYLTRDLNSIEWALQNGRGDYENSTDDLKAHMQTLFLSRRRMPWYRGLLRDQSISCQPKGRVFWSTTGNVSPGESSESTSIASGEIVDDFRQLEYLMSQIHDRLDASMAHITSQTTLLEAQRAHEQNGMTLQQNEFTFAQNKTLLVLALVGTFFLPISATAAVFSMAGSWAPGESSFPLFWAISIPLSLVLVTCFMMFQYWGTIRRRRRVRGFGGNGDGDDLARTGVAHLMANESGPPPAAGSAAGEKKEQKQPPAKNQPKDQPAAAAATQGGAPPAGDKKLSNAELKKKAKEEKAARRAAAKTTQPAPAASASSADAKGGKGKGKQQDGHPVAHHRAASRSALPPPAIKDNKPKIPDIFSHLPMAKRISITQADKDVHPAVLALGQRMAAFVISDSTTRTEATLLACKRVIIDYSTPHGATLSRHFTSHVLNPQIDYLAACRPMCYSMGNAIRWLKLQISKIDIDMPDSDAKKLLCESIDNYIRERITLADVVIVKTAADMVADGDVVITYAHHWLVERALIQAKRDGKDFKVILIDDAFERVGLAHAERLIAAGIPLIYATDFGALRYNLKQATLVLTGAEAMFSNGAMYARCGTSDLALGASDFGLRVVALCETINFTERVPIDSLTYNEIDPENCTDESFRLMFDTTEAKYITVVVSELGNMPAKSVPAILRKLEEL
ncbi:translation initiation factor eIF-2B subunit delta [Purpureocillium lavendulum]|uniref:Translation initiation factor eIF2B subunit delta n=1 Tax=Purpureocillium lavendulum TaxID=1247861 RepID=A0AB34FHI3_9HYPO|nr:translation initiation factor eIF-2B subunit delta [Purpureocillium lavendulum]